MGLDWFPSNRPKPGYEDEFAQLESLDITGWEDARRAQAEARFREISESPFDFARTNGHWTRLSFRAELLKEAVDVIGVGLLDRAWERQTSQELAAYGETLLTTAQSFARKHHLNRAASTEAAAAAGSEESDSRVDAFRITVAAAHWCLWWSAKGYGLFPDF